MTTVSIQVSLEELAWIVQTLLDHEDGISELAERLMELHESYVDTRGNQ